MADDLEDDELEGQPEPDQRAHIAPPSATNGYPAMSLRGLPAPAASPAPDPGSTDNLEAEGLASHIAPRPIASPSAPSASQSKMLGDENELQRKLDTGSGVSQIQHGSKPGGIGIAKPHPVLGGILRGLDIAGSVLAPTQMQVIPGTTLHHNLGVARDRGTIAQDTNEQEKEAQTAEVQSRANLTDQQAAELGQPKPKEEKWTALPGVTDAQGRVLQQEENSGQMRWAPEISGVEPVKQPNENQKDADIKDYLAAHKLPDTPANREKARTDIASRGKQEPGNFMPLYDEKGHVTGAWDPKSGRVVKGPNAEGTTTGGHTIATKATEAVAKEAAPYQQIVDTAAQAHDLADSAGKGNASADVDLVLSFFKMMKGAGGGGVRFTQQEQNMILGARSAGQGLVAMGQKVIGEGQALTPEQRKNMVDVIDMHAKAAQQHLDGMKPGGGTAENKGGTPAGATMKVPGSDGKLHWSDGKKDLGVAE